MKVSIVTWIGTGNFGTSLQSYALHRKLEDLGYQVSILPSFNPSDFTMRNKIRHCVKSPILWAKSLLRRWVFEPKNQFKIRIFNRTNYNVCIVSNTKQLIQLLKDIDVFITGSDQIWNCYHSYNPFYFLSFAGNNKRIAYASSMGTNDIPENRKKEVEVFLSKFSHIGVREKTAVPVLSELLNRNDIRQVADPTFLLDQKHWQEFAEKADIEFDLPKNYILCYFVGKQSFTIADLENIKQRLSIKNIILIPSLENAEISISNAIIYKKAGPYEFVKLIANAQWVCTDSFHATTISIILQKNFIEFLRFKEDDKKSQNSRIHDLLNHYNLNNKLLNNGHETLFDPIDYRDISKKVDNDREDCLKYLRDSIEL